MQWHQSPFWRCVAVAALVLLAGIFFKSGGAVSSVAHGQQGADGVVSSGGRLQELRRIGVVPWDETRGIFLNCDNAGVIHQYNLGSDWATKLNFEILSSETQAPESEESSE